MNKKSIIILIVVILAIILFLVFSGSSEQAVRGEVVTSADGKVSIQIPEGAVPEGLSLDDIAIENITAHEFFGLTEGQNPTSDVIAYSLLPDGTTFNSPVKVSIEADLETFSFENFVVPTFLHAYGDEDGNYILDISNNTDVQFNTEDGEVVVTGEIEHFSNVAVDRHTGLFRGEFLPAGGDYLVGDSFPFSITITDGETTYMTGNSSRWVNDAVEVTVSVGLGTVSHFNRGRNNTIRSHGHLTPQEVARPYQTVVARREYKFEQTYTCSDEGRDSLALVGGTSISFTKHLDVPRRSEARGPSFYREGASTHFSFDRAPNYNCVEEVEFEYVGPQTIEVGPGGEFIDRGYLDQGNPPTP